MINLIRNAFMKIDIWLLGVVILLILFGLAEMSSVSVYESFKLSANQLGLDCTNQAINCNNFYLKRQFFNVSIAVILMFIIIILPSNIWYNFAPILFFLSLVLMLLLFTKFGITLKGATGWLNITGLPSIQPVEIMKLSLILYLARWLENRADVYRSFQEGFIPYSIIVGLIVVLLALQPDFGAILVIIPTAFTIYFLAGARITHMVVSFIVISFVAIILLSSVPHIKARWDVFLNPDQDKAGLGASWQTKQSLIAVGSGGLWGVGIGESTQRFGYLPEVQGDTIYAVISEELGFFRTIILIVGSYLFFAWRGFKIAREASSRFNFLVASGITTWIVFQAIINISVNINLLPLTGITLPMISYGGSSIIAVCIGIGILLAISRNDDSAVIRIPRKLRTRK